MKRIFLMLFIIVSVTFAQKISVPRSTIQHIDSIVTKIDANVVPPSSWNGAAIDTGKTSSKVITVGGLKGIAVMTADNITESATKKLASPAEKNNWSSAATGVTTLPANRTVTFTTSHTAAQMQDSINAMPKNLGGYLLTIQFSDGTYTMAANLTFSDFYSGQINIQGKASETDALHSNQAVVLNRTAAASNEYMITILNCQATIVVRDLKLSITDGAYTGCAQIKVDRCKFLWSYGNYLEHSANQGFCLLANQTRTVYSYNNYVTRSLQAIRSVESYVIVGTHTSITANPSTAYYNGDGGIIAQVSTTAPAATATYGNDMGGVTFLQNLIPVAAPSTSQFLGIGSHTGTDGAYLGDPAVWFNVVDPATGTAYKIPAY